MAGIKENYADMIRFLDTTLAGFSHVFIDKSVHEVSAEEREKTFETLYKGPGFSLWLGNYKDILFDRAANDLVSDFVGRKIRERVKDQKVADKLIPRDHGYGTRRVPLETRYFECYNQPNVHLVDLRETPIEAITETGLRTSGGAHELDVIIYATGFDAITGSYERINFIGRDGRSLKDHWRDGPNTYLGTLVDMFPNLMLVAGPQSGSAAINFPRSIELSVDWNTRFLQFVKQHGYDRFEVSEEAVKRWADHVEQVYSGLLMRKAKSWFTGYNSNVEGRDHSKPRFLQYNGGQPKFREFLEACEASEYEGVNFL
jgi:cyclohexanone monooxygenase